MSRRSPSAFRLAPLGATILLLGACFPAPVTVDTTIDAHAGTLDEVLDRHTRSRARPGCHAELLIDGPASRAAFEELIRSAADHLHVITLNFDNDQSQPENTSLMFAELFADRARSGLPVRMILDPLTQQVLGPPGIREVLTGGGVELGEFRLAGGPVRGLLYRSHEKILLADGRTAIIGGMNFGYLYFGEGQWRDTNIRLGGPVVADVQDDFLQNWRLTGGRSPTGNLFPPLPADGPVTVRYIDQHPGRGDYDINQAVLIALRRARHRIDIETPYLNPSAWMIEELAAAHRRGVVIRILTNSRRAIDIKEVFDAMANQFQALLDAGAELYLWDQPRTMHSKAMVVDDQLAMVGSYNLNYRSIMWDTENVVVLTSPPSIAAVQAMLEADLTAPDVHRLDQGWLDAVPPEERSAWEGWLPVIWLF